MLNYKRYDDDLVFLAVRTNVYQHNVWHCQLEKPHLYCYLMIFKGFKWSSYNLYMHTFLWFEKAFNFVVTLLESQGSKRSEICTTDLHTYYLFKSKSTFSQQRKFKQAFMRKKIKKKNQSPFHTVRYLLWCKIVFLFF